MGQRGRISLAKLAVLLVALAAFAVALPSVAAAQGADGGDQTLNQSQSGAAGSESVNDVRSAGGDVNQIQQGAQQNCTIGGDGECNQSITQNAQINSGGGGGAVGAAAPVRRAQFVRSVPLARTGFDAWIIVLLGGVSLAGGLGLLAAQRRGSRQ